MANFVRTVLRKLVGKAKSSAVIDTWLRYNPCFYPQIRSLLSDLESAGKEARRELSSSSSDKVLGLAKKIYPAHLFRADNGAPVLLKEDLRKYGQKLRSPGLFMIPASTGGTSGIPLKLWRSLRCIAAEQAFLDHSLSPFGLRFRDAKVAVLRGDNVKNPNDFSPPFSSASHGHRRLVFSSQHLNRDTIGEYERELMDFEPDILWCYPSVIESFARLLLPQGVHVRPKLILTSSEVLPESSWDLLEGVFNCPILDIYGMAERVCFASALKKGHYFFNPAYGQVEFEDEEEIEAPVGYRQAAIIATGFINEGMPLIRYRTEDRILFPSHYTKDDKEEMALGLKPFTGILGRADAYLIGPHGETLVGIDHLPRETENIVRMQVVQESREKVIVNILPNRGYSKRDENALKANIATKIPRDMKVTIRTVRELEKAASGKVPYVIRRI